MTGTVMDGSFWHSLPCAQEGPGGCVHPCVREHGYHFEDIALATNAYVDTTSRCGIVGIFQQADLPGVGTVNAILYGHAVTRTSYYV